MINTILPLHCYFCILFLYRKIGPKDRTLSILYILNHALPRLDIGLYRIVRKFVPSFKQDVLMRLQSYNELQALCCKHEFTTTSLIDAFSSWLYTIPSTCSMLTYVCTTLRRSLPQFCYRFHHVNVPLHCNLDTSQTSLFILKFFLYSRLAPRSFICAIVTRIWSFFIIYA